MYSGATRLVGATVVILAIISIFATAAGMPPYTGDTNHPIPPAEMASILNDYHALQHQWTEGGVNEPAQISFREWIQSTPTASKNMLCILVEFSDKSSITDESYFDTLIYVNQLGSVRHYYNEVSFNTLDIVTVDLPSAQGWTSVSQTYAYYVNGEYGLNYASYPNNCQKLVEDAVDAVDAIVDFTNYDNDGDGWVDGLMVVHAGRGAELTHSVNDIWSHKWSISPRLKDGKYIFNYSMMPEYWYVSADMTLGVFCHELGHVFGLPDLYDTDYTSNGIGKWSIMASGSWNGTLGSSPAHFDAWCRVQLGFSTPTNVTATQYGASIPDVETNGTIYRLWTNGSVGNEFFLVENRRQIGYDALLPGSGLLIWHVDETQSGNDDEWYPSHTTSGNYLVALEQADNSFELEQAIDNGDAGDPFPGSSSNTTFSPLTSPGSDDYDGVNTLVAVSSISAPGATMTADFFVSFAADADDDDLDPPVPSSFNLSQNYPNPFNPSTTIEFSVDRETDAEFEVFNVIGQRVYGESRHISSPGLQQIEWKATDESDNELPAGIYFYKISLDDGRTSTKKMLLLK